MVENSQEALRGNMAVSIHIDPETGMAIATCTGALRPSDARDGAIALWNTPGWQGKSVVWDFRDACFEVSAADVRALAQFIHDSQPALPPRKIAFVTPRDVDFGLARMFEVFREDPRTEFLVCRDYDKAIHWARSLEPDDA